MSKQIYKHVFYHLILFVREFYASMTLYSTLGIMESLYHDTVLGDVEATRGCYGEFDLSGVLIC